MKYLVHLRRLQAQADRSSAADFTQFTQVPNGDFLDKNLKLRPEGIGRSGVATMQVREQGSEVVLQIADIGSIPTTKQVEYRTADGSFTHFTQDPIGALPSKTLHTASDKGFGDEHNLKGCFTQSGLKQLAPTAIETSFIRGRGVQSRSILASPASNHAVCGTSKFPNSRDVLDSSNDLRFISELCGDRLELDPINLEKNTPDRTCINCVKSDQTENHANTNSGNANVTPSCVKCRYASRNGNCTEPIAAGLSPKFMLISHKQGGTGCSHFAPAVNERLSIALTLIDRAKRLQAIDESDAETARTALERADPQDTKFVIEYESLLHACIRSLEARTGHDA